jgi:hypothetical protein
MAAHLLTALIIATFLLVTIAVIMFAVTRAKSKFARIVLTYAPVLLLVSCAGFWGASYPSTQAANSYYSNPESADAIVRLWSLWDVPWQLAGGIYVWWGVIALGSAICIWMGLRAFRHQAA